MEHSNDGVPGIAAKSGAAAILILLAVLSVSCGGGGSGTSGGPRPPPLPTLSYPSPMTFVMGTAIAAVSPTISGGTLNNFSISPQLPNGLSIDPSTGVISGTPNAVSGPTIYTVNSQTDGMAGPTATLSIAVNDKPPTVTYESPKFTFSTGVVSRNDNSLGSVGPVAPINPQFTATKYSISPALPPGLALDTKYGSITGTPTGTSPATAYTVTAQTASGQGTFNLTLQVDSGTVLELGHGAEVQIIRGSGSRMLSEDWTRHWVLWDYLTGTAVGSGDSDCVGGCSTRGLAADVAGSTVAIKTVSGFALYSSTDGHALSEISADVSWWRLAIDGSYVCAGSTAGLFAWSPAGAILFTKQGNYSAVQALAAPGEIRVGAGPAGADTIETIAVPSGSATTGPSFQGVFGSWFLDGSRFLASAGSVVFVYSKDTVQQDFRMLSTPAAVTGQGNYFWAQNGRNLDIYAVGNSASPAASYTLGAADTAVPSAATIGILHYPSGLSVIDLSGGTPTNMDYSAGRFGPYSAYAALSSTQWLTTGGVGLLIDSSTPTSRIFSLGPVSSIAASSRRIAVATATGQILYFDGATLAREGMINFKSSKLVMSLDGLLLAALGDQSVADCSVKLYALPSGAELYAWAYGCSGIWAIDIALSGSGNLLGQLLDGVGPNLTLSEFPSAGGSPLYSVPVEVPPAGGFTGPFVSPNGMQVLSLSLVNSPATFLYQSGNLVTALNGLSAGWIDDNRFIVNNYSSLNVYQGCTFYDATGHSIGVCSLPETKRFQTVSPNSIYSPLSNGMFSLTTGAKIWASGNPADSTAATAVSGPRIVFNSGHSVVAQTY